MKNYKIIETRPDLTGLALEQGMDFAKIKSKAALASKSATVALSTKVIVLNSLVGAVLISGTVFGIKQFNKEPLKEIAPLVQLKEETTAKKDTLEPKEIVAELSVTTPTKSPVKRAEVKINESAKPTQTTSVVYTPTVQLNNSISSAVTATPVTTTVIAASNTYSQAGPVVETEANTENEKSVSDSPNAKCVFVNDNSYWTLPDSLSFPVGVECLLGCEFNYTSVEQLSEQKNTRVLLLHVTKPQKKMLLKTNFSNISLNRKGASKHPIAVGIGDRDSKTKNAKYLNKNFKSKGAILRLGKKVDIFLIFENPKEGDVLMFDGFRAVLREPNG